MLKPANQAANICLANQSEQPRLHDLPLIFDWLIPPSVFVASGQLYNPHFGIYDSCWPETYKPLKGHKLMLSRNAGCESVLCVVQ